MLDLDKAEHVIRCRPSDPDEWEDGHKYEILVTQTEF